MINPLEEKKMLIESMKKLVSYFCPHAAMSPPTRRDRTRSSRPYPPKTSTRSWSTSATTTSVPACPCRFEEDLLATAVRVVLHERGDKAEGDAAAAAGAQPRPSTVLAM